MYAVPGLAQTANGLMNLEGQVDMEQKQPEKRLSRRAFLKGVPFGVAGVFVINALTSRFLPSASRDRTMPQFPEDSIFAPDKDRYGNTSL